MKDRQERGRKLPLGEQQTGQLTQRLDELALDAILGPRFLAAASHGDILRRRNRDLQHRTGGTIRLASTVILPNGWPVIGRWLCEWAMLPAVSATAVPRSHGYSVF